MRRVALIASNLVVVLGLCSLSALGGCQKQPKYTPLPAYSGQKANLPPTPKLHNKADFMVDADTWTVLGLHHHMNSPRHVADVLDKNLKIVGYVVDVYKPDAEPKGKEGCIFPTKRFPPTNKQPNPPGVDCSDVLKTGEPPHFWISDNKDDAKNADGKGSKISRANSVVVMGYSSTYIQQEIARQWYKDATHEKAHQDYLLGTTPAPKDDDLALDNLYSSKIVYVGEPEVGAKVVITGQFGTHYNEGSTGQRVEPYGIVDVTSMKHGKIDYKEGKELVPDYK